MSNASLPFAKLVVNCNPDDFFSLILAIFLCLLHYCVYLAIGPSRLQESQLSVENGCIPVDEK